MAAVLGYHGSTSFAEYEGMTPRDALLLAQQLSKVHTQEMERHTVLAKFVAGARFSGGGAEEVR